MRLLAIAAATALFVSVTRAADEPAEKRVLGEGVGATEADALKEALRDAVRQVVGAYITAETRIANDKVIQDNILTVSDGFVKSKEIVSTVKEGALVRVKILAVVKRDLVYEKLVASKVTAVKVPDSARTGEGPSDAAVERMTKDEALAQKTKLLSGMMADYPKVIFAQARMPDGDDYDKEAGKLTVDVRVLPDMKAYENWQRRLQARLAKISKGTHSGQLTGKLHDLEGKLPKTTVPGLHGMGGPKEELRGPHMKEQDTWCLWLMTSASENHDKTRWSGYVLDADLQKVLRPLYGQFVVKMDLIDGQAEKIAGEEFSIQESELHDEACWLGRVVSRARDDITGQNSWQWPLLRAVPNAKVSNADTRNIYVAPYFFTSVLGGESYGAFYAPVRTYRREINLTAEEWKKVKEIRCALSLKVEQPPKE